MLRTYIKASVGTNNEQYKMRESLRTAQSKSAWVNVNISSCDCLDHETYTSF